ncbi:type IV secretory system conjugative DNA transfer family protein [Listeria booriae]|uniref:VirD4-like conjugal transfer protein, CD1115 family n=1 Tax=Listeria booriae TaxID=1552123 RepID=UPI0016278078|nr:type IV secretory system conjugative DNA transfer family protein [Listeria booriae]MBC1890063.1 type IV secretory system conjugative DNA transfer family protein [Listeria booriae]
MSTKRRNLLLFGIILGIITFYLFHRVTILYESLQGDVIARLTETMDQLFMQLEKEPINLQFSEHSLLAGMVGFFAVALIILYQLSDDKKYLRGKEHGSATWGNRKDIQPFINHKVPEQNILLTKTEKLSLDMRMKVTSTDNFNRNKNVLVVGGAGSGKTRFFVKPNVMQMNASYVITESKGLLLGELGQMLRDNGYRIKVFDLINRKNCDQYNPFCYMKDEDDILDVVSNFIRNTNGSVTNTGDPFWEKSEKAFYSALFHYLLLVGAPEERTFSMVGNLVRSARIEGDDDQFVSALDLLFQDLEEAYPESFAVKQYSIYKLASYKTAKSILISAGVRLAPFDIPSIQELTAKDTLELDTLGDEKTALFICLPDTKDTLNFLVSMMYEQLFEKLVYKADTEYQGSLPFHVQCDLDEFANTGLIPNFEKKIAVIRSRNISANIILQNLSQLKHLYKDSWETIVGNCDSFLYLGGMEQSTHESVAKLLGKQTIDDMDISENKGPNGSYNKNHKKLGRSLLEPDEVGTIKGGQCILKIRGVRPFLSSKYVLEAHPNYKLITDYDASNWYEYQPAVARVHHFLKNVSTVEEVDLSIINNL